MLTLNCGIGFVSTSEAVAWTGKAGWRRLEAKEGDDTMQRLSRSDSLFGMEAIASLCNGVRG